MSIIFRSRNPIIVIELSSTAIKFLEIEPRAFKNEEKRHEIGRFYSGNYLPITTRLKEYVNDGILNLMLFEKIVLPKIMAHFERNLKKKPLSFYIGATGIYRNIKNSKEIIDLIDSKLKKIAIRKPYTFKLISAKEESRLSFLSWLSTYHLFGSTGEKRLFRAFFETQKGLAIDIGGGTTEVTIVENNTFDNTISIPIGVDTVHDQLNLGNVDVYSLRKRVSETKNIILTELEKYFSKTTNMKFCVCTGNSLIEKDVKESNSLDVKSINTPFALSHKIDLIEKLATQLLTQKTKEKIKQYHDLLKSFACLCILNEIFLYFDIKEYYINLANLRMGIFYDICNKKTP